MERNLEHKYIHANDRMKAKPRPTTAATQTRGRCGHSKKKESSKTLKALSGKLSNSWCARKRKKFKSSQIFRILLQIIIFIITNIRTQKKKQDHQHTHTLASKFQIRAKTNTRELELQINENKERPTAKAES